MLYICSEAGRRANPLRANPLLDNFGAVPEAPMAGPV